MLQILTKLFNVLQGLRLWMKLLFQGVILTVLLIAVQVSLEGSRGGFMSFLPPLGFFFLMFATYLIQPIVIGVINIFIINVLYRTRGWQVGFWLNGIFLLLAFSTINLILETVLGVPFAVVAVLDIVVFALPFGCIARFSNGGWNKPIN